MTFADFDAGAQGYVAHGYPLEEVRPVSHVFVQLDSDANGLLSKVEFSNLPTILNDLDQVAEQMRNESGIPLDDRRLSREEQQAHYRQFVKRRLAELDEVAARRALTETETYDYDTNTQFMKVNGTTLTAIEPIVCEEDGGKEFCPLDMTCKEDGNCASCGWKTAVDHERYECVQPNAEVCKNDKGQMYCPTDLLCHPPGDCSQCPSRPIADHAQHVCLEPWWEPQPKTAWTSWVCRHRYKNGRTCRFDQDCVYGMRRCLGIGKDGTGTCQSLQPYNAGHPCSTDLDCPHVGYYCPDDPTDPDPTDENPGEDPYWRKYCRRQLEPLAKCSEDRECQPGTLCNTLERPGRCRALFSLDVGMVAKHPHLCNLGYTDANDKCAVAAMSKDVGRSCGMDADCETTDITGKSGVCACKSWWDGDEPKQCLPVAGDLSNHLAKWRAWYAYRKDKCGTFWTDDECVEEFGEPARKLLYGVKCEEQRKANGDGPPPMPPPGCKIPDLAKRGWVDYCGSSYQGSGALGHALLSLFLAL